MCVYVCVYSCVFIQSTTLYYMSYLNNDDVGAAVDAGAAIAAAGAANVIPQAAPAKRFSRITVEQDAKKRKTAKVVDKELQRLKGVIPPAPVISPRLAISRDEAAFNNGSLLVDLRVEGWTQPAKWMAGVLRSTATRRPVGQQGAAPAKHVLVVVEHEDPERTTRPYRVECVRKVLD